MPSITGQFLELSLAQFQELAPDGQPLHFSDRYVDGILQTEIDPLTGADTGLTAQQILTNLGNTHGWPLKGLFVSQVGRGEMKHYILHREDFPAQTGSAAVRESKLNEELTTSLATVFHIPGNGLPPSDENSTEDFDPFFANVHFWNYRDDNLYEPKAPGGGGDYAMRIEDRRQGAAPANWWQELN